MLTFLDCNVVVSALGHLGGIESVNDLANCYPLGNTRLETVRHFAQCALASGSDLRLVASEPSLIAIAQRLERPSADLDGSTEFEPLDHETALTSTAAYAALTHASSGLVTTTTARSYLPQVNKTVPTHLQGNAKGQIDYEDRMILAACLAALAETGEDHLVLVSDDHGLQNCAASFAALGVSIISTVRYARIANAS